ncbi:hypothetical protein F2Q70_00038317 [Brassica cretica]|uniref:DUF4283 domain-containing protein n=1 Tax=Brassica cretica TaxID=69181 RepID=A0A8S9K8X8_BRACR|nr:hypothetical protein F2Q70_00038317 [Brassica cretica]
MIVGNQLAALWPTLNDEILNKQPKGKYPSPTTQPPIEKLPPPEIKVDGSLHFPWTARSSAQSRNLYRAGTPTYRLDCTPEVSIPFRLGTENKDKYTIGKFHKCSLPPGGLVHAVRGVCHINDCLLFVLPWTPEASFKVSEISTLPIWATLKNILDCCYSRLGIRHVASGLGKPILTHKPRLDPTSLDEAKVLVEMELDRNFSKIISLDDKQGHKEKRCLVPSSTAQVSASTSPSIDTSYVVPLVDIDTIPQLKDNVGSSPPTIH